MSLLLGSLRLLLVSFLVACSSGGGGGSTGADSRPAVAASNVSLDSDGNGALDRAVVGDWDGDGLYETEDIQQAIETLSDHGPKTVELEAGRVFGSSGASLPVGNTHGLIELSSRMELDCRGSRIEGVAATDFASGSWSGLLATITNAVHDSPSDEDVRIVDCEVTGGMPAVYDGALFPHDSYMAVAFVGVHGGSIIANRVHDTHHSCIYLKNSHDLLVEGNEMERCGGVGNSFGGSPTLPGVYLYSGQKETTERITVRGNSVIHAGNALYNTRVTPNNDQYQTAWMSEIVFEGNYGEDDDGDVCFNLRGPRGISVRSNTCRLTSGIYLSRRNRGFCSENPPARNDGDAESACLSDVKIVDNVLVDNVSLNSDAVVTLNDYHEGVRLSGNQISGSTGNKTSAAISVELPHRGLTIEDATLTDCAGACLRVHGADQFGVPPDEHIVIRGVRTEGAGALARTSESHACFRFDARLEGAVIEDVEAIGCTGVPIAFVGGVEDVNLHGFQVDRLPAGSLGSFDLALGPLPPCNAARDDHWLVLRGSDGSCTGAVGNQVVRCACQAGIWNVYTPTSHPGLSIAASRGLSVTGGVVQNVDDDAGIAFESAGTHDATLTDVTFRQPLLDEVVIEPMTRGVWDQSEGGGVGTTNITCDPGAVSGLCVDLSGP